MWGHQSSGAPYLPDCLFGPEMELQLPRGLRRCKSVGRRGDRGGSRRLDKEAGKEVGQGFLRGID